MIARRKLRLKHDEHRKGRVAHKLAIEKVDAIQVKPCGDDFDDQIQDDQDDADALEQSRSARAAQESNDPIDHEPDQQPLGQQHPPGVGAEDIEEGRHRLRLFHRMQGNINQSEISRIRYWKGTIFFPSYHPFPMHP